ncbi:hypothetical protein P4S65_10070 [Pseudoalteromonas sp. B131b]|uniref:hypothetical protein n=1 Tax=Pseudoalteromonas sp. B131b TaxID=630493 RepID=UPI00301E01B7
MVSIPNSSKRLKLKVEALTAVAESLSCNARLARELCRDVLSTPQNLDGHLIGASALNNDGAPLQLCLSSSEKEVVLRVIGDPCSDIYDTEDRYFQSVEALKRGVIKGGAQKLLPLVETTLTQIIPNDKRVRDNYKKGFVWLALSPDKAGVAFYLETAPLGQELAWQRVEKWLDALLPESANVQILLSNIKQCANVASVGLEGTTSENTRAKIYFRLKPQVSLSDLGLDLYTHPSILQYLTIAMGTHGVDADGLLLGLGINLSNGEVADIKLDLCGHCLKYTNAEWQQVSTRLTQTFGLKPLDLKKVLNQQGCNVAFIGFGLDSKGKNRLNIYLNNSKNYKLPSQDETRAAIDDAIDYLIGLQQQNGLWSDYKLPVGESTEWITGYVGLALARAGNQLNHSKALKAAINAAQWLIKKRAYHAGWGYNHTTGADADSSAMAMALLRELKLPIDKQDHDFIVDHWDHELGLATYKEANAWGDAHWDVTPVGYLILPEKEQLSFKPAFMQGLKHNHTAQGFYRSYWWRTPFYSTFQTLEVLEQLNLLHLDTPITEQPSMAVDNAFDLACALGIHYFRSQRKSHNAQALRTLLNWQQATGVWQGCANLRVTENTCYEPWDHPEGKYYTDLNGTITTATIIRVLTQLLSILPPLKGSIDG